MVDKLNREKTNPSTYGISLFRVNELFTNKKYLIPSIVVVFLLAVNLVLPAHAIYLDSAINTKEKTFMPAFKFQKTIYIKYPEGGKISELLNGKNTMLNFSADSRNQGVPELIKKLNDNLKNLQSNAVVTDLKVTYNVHLEGKSDSAVIDYNVVLTPTMTGHILREESANSPTLIDTRWRGMSVDGPAVIRDSSLEDVDISSPLGFFKTAVPDFYSEQLYLSM